MDDLSPDELRALVATLRADAQRAHRNLRVQMDLTQAIYDTMEEGLLTLDQAGRLASMNRMARYLLGWGQGELLGKHIADHVSCRIEGQSSLDAPHPFLQPLAYNRAVSSDAAIISRKDRSTFPASFRARLMRSDQVVTNVIVTFADRSREQAYEQRLRASERDGQRHWEQTQALMNALGASGAGVVLYDEAGQIIGGNSAAALLFRHEADTTHWLRPLRQRLARYETRDSENRPFAPTESPLQRVLRGETLAGESAINLIVRMLDGRDRPVQFDGAPLFDNSGKVIGAVCILRPAS